jgi:hypothetical protein
MERTEPPVAARRDLIALDARLESRRAPGDPLAFADFAPNEPPSRKDEPPSRKDEPPSRNDEPVRAAGSANSLPSCESAAASANEVMEFGADRGAPDLTRDAFASVLENGAYLARCAVPATTALEICAAVQDGRVVGVSVVTQPRNPALGACVRGAVAALRFPHSARLDVTRTRFEATR